MAYEANRPEEGAEEHVQAGAMTLLHQRLFDWLDETWAMNDSHDER